MITNPQTGTRIDEVSCGIYRINTPLDVVPGGFSLNSYLIVDDEPVLFHTGYRRMFPVTREAIAAVIPPESLRWVGGSHFEGDEFGAMNEFLAIAPQARAFSSFIGALTSVEDMCANFGDRPVRGLNDGEEFSIGSRTLRWLYTPHVPHGWDCGVLFDSSTSTLLCGDLFTQPGSQTPPVTESEVLSRSEAFRQNMDYFAHAKNCAGILEKLAMLKPQMLACQHGSAFRGDGAQLLRGLASLLNPAKIVAQAETA